MKKLSEKTRRNLTLACRLVLALTFIFSGFTKVIDPWGTAIKINEYFAIYGVEHLKPLSMTLAIWLCGAELMMGCMLLCKVRIRLISIFALAAMIFFTILTFLSATVIPVEDCGCFGDAIKLTPWQTFVKNLVLLPMSVVVWWYYRSKGGKILSFSPLEILLTLVFFFFAMGLGFYSYSHLPMIDFLPYKKGVNIREQMSAHEIHPGPEMETVLVYRNRRTGKLREFSIDDTAWHNEQKWEWVETKILDEIPAMHSMIEEFALRTPDGEDATNSVLSTPGRLYMICVTSFDRIGRPCERRLQRLIEQAAREGAHVVCLTPQPLTACTLPIPCYNIDASTMKTMLRAYTGVVVLDNGTITDKRNCRDID